MVNFRSLSKLKRSRQIATILVKYGLDCFIDRSKMGFLIKIRKRPKDYQTITVPERLRLALDELGPTFVKFGQILSTRPDLLPPVFIEELEKLQDRVAPFDSIQAKKIVEQELGKPLDQLFKQFESKPIAAASLSQVHKATLLNGKTVAVKIQRPKIKEIIELDLDISIDLAGLLEHRLHNGWVYHPKLIVKEFKRAIEKEINFKNEAHNYEKFRINFKDIDYIKVPKVYWEMTTSKVLVMEFIDGVKINEITHKKHKDIFELEKVAKHGAESVLKQILEDGFFHADPHPGNLLIMPGGVLGVLDYGIVGRLEPSDRYNLGRLFVNVIQ
ncbi:MAG: AarF/ABC1/UbiB kinase family protein, partial [Candidatus Peribacteraceae bacterium]|nr:AarF/ABC1/UbiB kinase family protein [Candidatus Peribacteraceae bacterium]